MIHVVFYRPVGKLKVYGPSGALAKDSQGVLVMEAAGDAWGAPGYGHDGWCPRGHYLLGPIQTFAPIASEGAAQIDVSDLPSVVLQDLVAIHAAVALGDGVVIGGVGAPVGQLAKYGRDGIMIHGGGSNAPDPFAPYQQLCKTEGCTRVHNADLARLVAYLLASFNGNHVIYSTVGDPLPLSC
jgi:hypothetical protein